MANVIALIQRETEGFSGGQEEASDGAENVRLEGIPGLVRNPLEGVIVKLSDGLAGREELGTIEVWGWMRLLRPQKRRKSRGIGKRPKRCALQAKGDHPAAPRLCFRVVELRLSGVLRACQGLAWRNKGVARSRLQTHSDMLTMSLRLNEPCRGFSKWAQWSI